MAKKPNSNSIKIDFTGVESGGFDVPDGQYALAVSSVTQKKSESSGQPYLSWEFKVDEGKYKGRKVWDNTSLQPQALWKLRSLLECMGMDIEDGEFELDLSDFEGNTIGAEIANEKYQGKDKPRIVGYMAVDEIVEGDEEEAEEEEKKEPVKTTKKTTKKEPEPEPEEEAEEEAEEEQEEAEPEPEPEPPKTTKKKKVASFEVGQKVSFEDEGKTIKGTVHAINEDSVEVKVGKDIWELEKSDLTAA